MAEEEDIAEENDDELEGKEVGGKKKILILIVAVLLLGGIGAGLFFSGVLGGGDATEEAAEQTEEEVSESQPAANENGEVVAGAPVYYELPEFLVNLSSGSKKTSFLKMKVTLELTSQEAVAQMDAYRPRIEDAFNTYLRELRASDLSGSAGLYRLREELLGRVNKAVHPVQVKDILFNEIVVN